MILKNSLLKTNGVKGDQFAIASALILGSKDELDFKSYLKSILKELILVQVKQYLSKWNWEIFKLFIKSKTNDSLLLR